jgi:quercetin dioxygenase-like cupin family protein
MLRFLQSCKLAILAMTVMAHMAAQDGATALQHNYRILLDNEQMQVVRVHYGPHEALPVHDHSHYPTVYVYLSNSGPVRFIHDGASPFTLTRRPVSKGWFRVSPGRNERHQVANLGPGTSDFLRVECKRIPLRRIPDEFRYSKEVDLTKTSVVTDYASPEMVIQRYVMTSGKVEHVAAETPGELLIAFTPAIVREQGSGDQRMAAGSVLWVKANTNFDLSSAGTTAAHLLTIRLLK